MLNDKQKRKNKTLIYVLAVILLVSFVFNVVLGIVTYRNSKKINMYEQSSELEGSELIDALKNINSQKNKISSLQNEITDLQSQVAECENKIKNKTENEEELNKNITELNSEISSKKTELENAKQEYDLLMGRYSELEKIYKSDFDAQLALLSEISDLLANPPKKITKIEKETEDGEKFEETEESEPTISVVYLDIERGYKYAFNAQHVFSSASVVKLPFALSLLQAASMDIENNKPTDTKDSTEETKEYIPFGFDEKFVYQSEYFVEGSGVIQHKPFGTEFTFLELVDYSVRHSDNVAFRQLTKKYKMDLIYKFANDNNLSSMRYNAWNMTANDAATIMKLTYDFIKEDKNYGKFLEESLLEGAHKVMTVPGVYPKKCAHKYGWDDEAYHDVTIVYDEHPYVIVFMSDLHQGGTEVDKYIQSIARKIDKFHTNFYKD